MRALPNNCRCSKINVYPPNWKKGGKSLLKEKWYISYRFYDDNLKCSKKIKHEAFNTYEDIEDRRRAISQQLKQIDEHLGQLGYNPIAIKVSKPFIVPENQDINRFTPFVDALKYAKTILKVSEDTMKSEINWVLREIEKSAKLLYFDKANIWDISLKHLYLICEKAAYKKPIGKSPAMYSGNKFNRNVKVLRLLYKKLVMLEVVPVNYLLSIERQKGEAKKKKVLLSKDERKKLVEYLEKNSPQFLLFVQIFFHSGARLTEMLRLQIKDVDFVNQSISYLVMKGRQAEYKERPMKDIAVQYWRQAVGNAARTDYVFSTDLLPGPELITTNTIKLRWRRLQHKDKLNIKAAFYALKHLNTTETTTAIGRAGAAIQNAESEEMIEKHYDMENQKREHDKIKKVNNPL